MSDENAEDTGKQTVVAPAREVSPSFPAEQAPATQSRSPEFGDSVLYVDGDRTLNATIQVAFIDGRNHLRVLDPESQLGQFDVQNAVQDVQGAQGTFHYAQGTL